MSVLTRVFRRFAQRWQDACQVHECYAVPISLAHIGTAQGQAAELARM